MADPFLPQYTDELPLRDLKNREFLVLALEAAHQVGWGISYISDIGFIALTNNDPPEWNAEIRIRIVQNYAQIETAGTGGKAVPSRKIKEQIAFFTSKFQELKPQFTDEQLDLQYEFLSPYIVSGYYDVLKHPSPESKKKSNGFLSFFLPVDGYFVTPLLANLNFLLFFIMVATGVNIMEPDSHSLLSWGANYRPYTLNGDWWRLITNCFLHIGVLHVILNMYALLSIGFLLEPYLGKRRFLAAYLLTGLVASMASLWWHQAVISAGASGAIFGMYGVFLAMLTTNLIDRNARQPLLISIAIFVGYNLLNGLKDGIDNAAHMGGLLSGIAIGYAFLPSLKHPDSKALHFGTMLVTCTVILFGLFIAYQLLANA